MSTNDRGVDVEPLPIGFRCAQVREQVGEDLFFGPVHEATVNAGPMAQRLGQGAPLGTSPKNPKDSIKETTRVRMPGFVDTRMFEEKGADASPLAVC